MSKLMCPGQQENRQTQINLALALARFRFDLPLFPSPHITVREGSVFSAPGQGSKVVLGILSLAHLLKSDSTESQGGW